jgi:hypothetical protein
VVTRRFPMWGEVRGRNTGHAFGKPTLPPLGRPPVITFRCLPRLAPYPCHSPMWRYLLTASFLQDDEFRLQHCLDYRSCSRRRVRTAKTTAVVQQNPRLNDYFTHRLPNCNRRLKYISISPSGQHLNHGSSHSKRLQGYYRLCDFQEYNQQ